MLPVDVVRMVILIRGKIPYLEGAIAGRAEERRLPDDEFVNFDRLGLCLDGEITHFAAVK
jgi:hypothetical protein